MRLKLEPASPIPMYLQIIEQVRHGIAVGALQADDEMPSVRALASKTPHQPEYGSARLPRTLSVMEASLEATREQGTYVAASATALSESHRLRAVRDLLDKALAVATEFGLSPKQVRTLVDERLAASKEKSA